MLHSALRRLQAAPAVRALSTSSLGPFAGKNVLITGSAAGLGEQIAVELAKCGASTAVLVDQPDSSRHEYAESKSGCSFNLDKVEQRIAEASGGNTRTVKITCDISDEAQVRAMAATVGEELGAEGLHVLVNNAGFNGKCQLVKDMVLADWEYTMRVNLTGTMLVCRELIPLLQTAASTAAAGAGEERLKRCIRGGNTAIVNIASNVAKRGLPYR